MNCLFASNHSPSFGFAIRRKIQSTTGEFSTPSSRIAAISQVLDPSATRPALGGIALVKPLQIVDELRIGQLDELRQRPAGKIAVFVVDRLDTGTVDREQFAAKQIQLPAQQHELAEDRPEGFAVEATEVGNWAYCLAIATRIASSGEIR
jgi:hypothetical protein